MTVQLRTDFDVSLVDHSGSDDMICRAARVSTGTDEVPNLEKNKLIQFLLRNRHGSPFEHGMMTFRISAPIFVWREFMRHRIGFSYNEQSGRYMEMEPFFYVPNQFRPLIQVGKPGAYHFVAGSQEQQLDVVEALHRAAKAAWQEYVGMLYMGIAKEVARMCLPVNIYSSAYVTCNPRSLMSFLSLRTQYEGATFPSYPQWEIRQVANLMEAIFEGLFPFTHDAFNTYGRVSP